MVLRSLLAKDWVLEVDTRAPNAAEPQWTRVNGLTSFSESTDDNTEDDAAFEGDGWGSSVVTQRTWSIEAEPASALAPPRSPPDPQLESRSGATSDDRSSRRSAST